MKRIGAREMSMCALFAALTAVLSQVSIPIGPVPINLATFAVFAAGAMLGAKLGTLSIAVWVALGAFGVPVFSGFQGGLGRLFGPTGGYILGFLPAAWLTGLLCGRQQKKSVLRFALTMLPGMLIYLLLGTIWFMHVTGNGLAQALALCVWPFIPGDFIKIFLAATLALKLPFTKRFGKM